MKYKTLCSFCGTWGDENSTKCKSCNGSLKNTSPIEYNEADLKTPSKSTIETKTYPSEPEITTPFIIVNPDNKLTKCRTCGGKVAKSSLSCPHCGEKGPRAVEEEKLLTEWFWSIGKYIFYVSLGLHIATKFGFEEARQYNYLYHLLTLILDEFLN